MHAYINEKQPRLTPEQLVARVLEILKSTDNTHPEDWGMIVSLSLSIWMTAQNMEPDVFLANANITVANMSDDIRHEVYKQVAEENIAQGDAS